MLTVVLAVLPGCQRDFHGIRPLAPEHFRQLSQNLYCGGEPPGPAGFAALKNAGVRTILCVDGAFPDAATAKTYGLDTVHLPIGYDGISSETAVQLTKAVRELPGPVFIHCHHGKHRGPAMAALAAIASEGWNSDQAIAWMHEAGTSPDYAGLFESVRQFKPLPESETAALENTFSSRASVADLAQSMAVLDRNWDALLLADKHQFATDTAAAHEKLAGQALLLHEAFREISRMKTPLLEDADFTNRLDQSILDTQALHQALSNRGPAWPEQASHAVNRLAAGCKSCHKRHR